MIVCWDPQSYKIVFKARIPSRCTERGDIDSFAVSADDSAIACGCPSFPAVLFWDTNQLRSGHGITPSIMSLNDDNSPQSGVNQVQFMPDGRTVACSMQDGGEVKIYGLNSVTGQGEVLALVQPGPDAGTGYSASGFHEFCVNPTGTLLVGCTSDKLLRLYDLTVARATFVHHYAFAAQHDDGEDERETLNSTNNNATNTNDENTAVGNKNGSGRKLAVGKTKSKVTGIEVAPFLRQSSWVDSIFKRRDHLAGRTRKNQRKQRGRHLQQHHHQQQRRVDAFSSDEENDQDESDDDSDQTQPSSSLAALSGESGQLPRLAMNLAPAHKALNRQRLLDLYNLQGRFPSKYRKLIWRFLLR